MAAATVADSTHSAAVFRSYQTPAGKPQMQAGQSGYF